MKALHEFKEFAVKGNVVDMAVGVVIGGAFGKIVASLVDNVIMPPIGKIFASAGGDWKSAQIDALGIKHGAFLGSVVDFIIIALVLFVVVVKFMGLFQKQSAPVAPTTKACTECLEVIPLAAKKCRACASTQPV